MENETELKEAEATTPVQTVTRGDATRAGIAKLKSLGLYKGGRPAACPTCGWCHKVGNPCKEPKNETSIARIAKKNSGSVPPVPQP